MLGMPPFTALATFDDAHGTEGLAAVEAVEFESPLRVPLAHAEAVLPALEVVHEGLVVVQGEPLVPMKFQPALVKVLQRVLFHL